MEFAEEIRDFLIESNENLANLDQEIVELEKNPKDEKLIASVFRTIHTIKGTSGFFGFKILGSITHVAENILGQVREKQRDLTPELVSLVLATVDAVRAVLVHVESRGDEGIDIYEGLRQRLEQAYLSGESAAGASKDAKDLGHPERRNAERVASDKQQAAEQEKIVPVQPLAIEETAAEYRQADGEAKRRRRPDDQNSSNSTIRVEVNLLDKLMNLVGELVLARNQILQGAAQSATTSATAQRLNLITSELQEGVMRTRMQPIGVVWNKLPRVVRDLASEMGKKIEIVMEGAETELDKTIIEAIKDPLTHIVRNSCDHGIETMAVRTAKGKKAEGTIVLRAFHEGGHVNIEISDDGAGFDTERMKRKAIEKGILRAEQASQMTEWEALRLIFHPGFSTAEKVTSISGRGVGMDVVKTNIEKISGTVELANRAGAGTTIKIKIPLTLAIIPGLIVSVRSRNPAGDAKMATESGEQTDRDHRFVIPQANLLELVRLEGTRDRQQIERIHGAEVYRRRGNLLPLAYLSDVLGLPSVRKLEDVINIVVVKAEDTAFGLVVDEVNDTQEIVVKALGKQLKSLSCYVGATIMGDGRIALILDVTGVARLANMLSQPLDRTRSVSMIQGSAAEPPQMMLLFRSGKFPRLVLPLSVVARLEEISASRVEYAGGAPVIRYREAILPLFSLSQMLDPGSPALEMNAEDLQVIVFSEAGRYVGMVVDEILDIVDDHVTIKRASSTFGLLGSGVVGGKITDFVDLAALLTESAAASGESLAMSCKAGQTLILVDQRKISRGIMRSYLEMHGHRVIEFSDLNHAAKAAERIEADVLIISLESGTLPVEGREASNLLKSIRRNGTREIPIIAVTPPGIHTKEQHIEDMRDLADASIDATEREMILAHIDILSPRYAAGGTGATAFTQLTGAGASR
jgi:two-component system chemotaxis sensor kinase CheA